MPKHEVIEELKRYEDYLSIIPTPIQAQWVEYYDIAWLVRTIAEIRSYEMTLSKDKVSSNRPKFINDWIRVEHNRLEPAKLGGEGMLALAHEMRRKREDENLMMENSGSY